MKKLLLATLVTTAIAPAIAKPYAQIDAGIYQFSTDGKESRMRVESNASRFGYKAEAEVGPSTSAIGQAEFGLETDGDTTELKHRNVFVGLKNTTYGTVKVGHQDSYVKLAQGKVDFFNDQAGEEADMKKVFAGESRLQNAFMYESPSFNGVNVNVMLQQGEADVAEGTADARTGLADGISASVTYSNDALYAALAMDKDVSAKSDNDLTKTEDTTRLVASYKLPVGVVLNGMYQMTELSESTTNKESTGYLVGVGYDVMENVFVKAQYQNNDTTETGKKDVSTNQFGVGVDYAWSDKVKSSVMYTTREDTKEVKHDIIGVSTQMKF